MLGVDVLERTNAQVRLSERTVVDLLVKIDDLGHFSGDLLHTSNGYEYITKQCLRREIEDTLHREGGR